MEKISCENCKAVCCHGEEVLYLTPDEASFMLGGGNELVPVSEATDYDREEVLYPRGYQRDAETGKILFFTEEGREYEPLPAGFGRYIITGACTYLETTDDGWEYCGVYDERPKVCRDFEEGGDNCQLMRIMHGVDSAPVTFLSGEQLLQLKG